jgi:thiamine pyrophosphate-dependent acetolactate synthase large subunit-like protein
MWCPLQNSFGVTGVQAKTKQEIKQAFAAALKADGPTVIAIPIARQERLLVPPVHAFAFQPNACSP